MVLKGLAEEQALLDHCRATLASYKVPRGIFFIEEMPKTALGKIIKPELTARLATPGETVSP